MPAPSQPDPRAVANRLRDAWPVRAVAALTTAYGVAITVAPKLLAKPCGLTRVDGSVPTDVAQLTRSIGTRDAALALALAVSPTGSPMQLLTAARVVSDAADAAYFARVVPASQRTKVAGVAAGWAALELAVAAYAARARSR
ncbi:hypothetical protein SAMN05443575_0933 [Jatrophihabitans endophyticus]|uniref:DUF4267 domain-containing protein n=1 Tax=Jatrophihabitans endophyticus TaxID=1206085 RepID=A0A1M5EM36_9ACTN|nr:hypothetical protein [Jatrophihabitans endophyticus]SHF80151.1 hypothetical protein SAMN05443575_0933 [Jatrophihabitans endophyticus]